MSQCCSKLKLLLTRQAKSFLKLFNEKFDSLVWILYIHLILFVLKIYSIMYRSISHYKGVARANKMWKYMLWPRPRKYRLLIIIAISMTLHILKTVNIFEFTILFWFNAFQTLNNVWDMEWYKWLKTVNIFEFTILFWFNVLKIIKKNFIYIKSLYFSWR